MKNIERKVVFNHHYRLKHDLKRTYLYSVKKSKCSYTKVAIDTVWITKIHPVYAMIFSFMSEPVVLSDLFIKIAYFLDVSRSDAECLVGSFLDKNEPFYSEYDGVISQFPRNLVIDSVDLLEDIIDYSPLDFTYESLDFKTERALFSPQTAVIMPNSNCTTDCAYCYADRSRKLVQMDFSVLKSIVEQCRLLRMLDITITGGDIFLYKYWKELFELLNVNGFDIGLLSTKTPLRIEDVKFLSKYNFRLQFSLDSINPIVCKSLLGTNDIYMNNVKNTFETLGQFNLDFKIATVLTNINGEVEYLSELYDFIKQFKSLREWEIRLASKSLYSKSDFDALTITKEKLVELNDWIVFAEKESVVNISWDISEIDKYFKSQEGSKKFIGARCSANYSNIMILPDGKVTICEQLYWNENYIIGDIKQQSIAAIWNSKRALELAYPSRDHFRDISACKTCRIFNECYAYPNRCIVDVLKGYGLENGDYPDPRCERAPRQILTLTPL